MGISPPLTFQRSIPITFRSQCNMRPEHVSNLVQANFCVCALFLDFCRQTGCVRRRGRRRIHRSIRTYAENDCCLRVCGNIDNNDGFVYYFHESCFVRYDATFLRIVGCSPFGSSHGHTNPCVHKVLCNTSGSTHIRSIWLVHTDTYVSYLVSSALSWLAGLAGLSVGILALIVHARFFLLPSLVSVICVRLEREDERFCLVHTSLFHTVVIVLVKLCVPIGTPNRFSPARVVRSDVRDMESSTRKNCIQTSKTTYY